MLNFLFGEVFNEYRETHPEVTVLDPPGAIAHLLDRQSMLQEVSELDLSDCYGKVGVPKQLLVNTDPSSIPTAVTRAGLSLPLVAKPLVAKSHELSLAYDPSSLTKLEPPLVLQEFVNHGGVMFKVYIVGDAIRVVRRFSLPNVDEGDLSNNAGVFRFPRVSCAAANADDADLDPCVAELPPRPLLEILARELRRRLGLRLFNIDMIREHGTKDRFYVIDMNYFPETVGVQRLARTWLVEVISAQPCTIASLYSCYGKMPGYEHVFTDFLLSLAQKEYKRRPSYSSCEG
ncbi:inositol-tetrakisphosphate 1-kinase 3 isoform X4 [Phragmites australis]|uniref:inositol-tetrakisphosphate 1-kinase 3 isoform X4 n=1 Tax=Phragmites australis TaxID=29695 RepID=UPI002D76A844|nr:inositol-tetrakisphosphate 1-kinase 3 isoform X4 [Phragmites australis]XP_062214728.1 inositol-tetrakisphosphate 1-kinase 3 isoform X4 [Phragmites australis]